MASQARDWTVQGNQWKNGIDLATATNQDLEDFTQYKLWEYERDNLVDTQLWTDFADDFETFTIDIFLKIPMPTLQDIFNYLQQGRVYIQTKDKHTKYP
jgi:hypothetical protein